MRVIFALLVLLNVAYLAYQQLFAAALSENRPAAVEQAQAAADGEADVGQGSLHGPPHGPSHGPLQETQRAKQAAGAAQNQPRLTSHVSSRAAAKPTKPAPREGTVAALPAVEESTGQNSRQISRNKGQGCTIIGPFASEAIVKSLVAQLKAEGIQSDVESAETKSLPDYLVYVGPERTRSEARRLMNQFQSQAIDSYLIDKGEFENAISLGMFTRQPFAKALTAKMRKAGFDAKIRPLPRTRQGYQLRADLPADLYEELLREENPLQECPLPASA